MGFDETVMHCGAPALCGIKPASLFSMTCKKFQEGTNCLNEWNVQFSKQERFIIPFKRKDGSFLFFVYDKRLLQRILSRGKNRDYLLAKGYQVEMGLNCVLKELFRRLSQSENFPHEVGLFLGYPLEDVVGFEINGARNYKFSGIWKVYGNKERAIKKMNRYRICSETCMKLLAAGFSVPLATKKYIGGIK